MDQTTVAGDAVRGGRPWWQICCGGCFLFFVAVVVGGMVLMRSIVGPGVVSLPHLPDNFPKDIVPYRLEQVQSISYLEGKSKSKMLKVLAAPMRLLSQATGQGAIDKEAMTESGKAVDSLGSDAQYIDTVTMTWKGLPASQDSVQTYYMDQFKQAKLTVDVSHEDDGQELISGIKEGMIVTLSLRGGATSTTDEIEFVVSYSNKR